MTFQLPSTCMALLAFCMTARAAVDEPGIQSRLSERGIDLHLGYISQTATNVQGGDRTLWGYADEWDFSARLDLERLFGLSHAEVRVTITDRNGRNLSADAGVGAQSEPVLAGR